MKHYRACSHPRCKELITSGKYCDTHKAQPGPPRERGEFDWAYRSTDWKRIRSVQLAKQPLCCRCLHYGIVERAKDVDHVIAHEGDLNLFYDKDNLQSLCHSCHSWKTNQERKGIYYGWAGGEQQIYRK